jgi:hypothetical protein
VFLSLWVGKAKGKSNTTCNVKLLQSLLRDRKIKIKIKLACLAPGQVLGSSITKAYFHIQLNNKSLFYSEILDHPW